MSSTGGRPLLTKREVRTRLAVSPRSLDRLIAAGEFEVIRLNSRVTRITPESLEAYLARRTRQAATA